MVKILSVLSNTVATKLHVVIKPLNVISETKELHF